MFHYCIFWQGSSINQSIFMVGSWIYNYIIATIPKSCKKYFLLFLSSLSKMAHTHYDKTVVLNAPLWLQLASHTKYIYRGCYSSWVFLKVRQPHISSTALAVNFEKKLQFRWITNKKLDKRYLLHSCYLTTKKFKTV